MRLARDTLHEVHLPRLDVSTLAIVARAEADEQAQLVSLGCCGVRFARLADGAEVLCDLPAGHVTLDGLPSAHAWGTR